MLNAQARNEFSHTFIELRNPADKNVAFPAHDPQVFELYWSVPQLVCELRTPLFLFRGHEL